jgi:putative flavoprotein involved in K+ transport
VWHDARHIADHIVMQRKYQTYYDGPESQVKNEQLEKVQATA